jgi:hypothetical protein
MQSFSHLSELERIKLLAFTISLFVFTLGDSIAGRDNSPGKRAREADATAEEFMKRIPTEFK